MWWFIYVQLILYGFNQYFQTSLESVVCTQETNNWKNIYKGFKFTGGTLGLIVQSYDPLMPAAPTSGLQLVWQSQSYLLLSA